MAGIERQPEPSEPNLGFNMYLNNVWDQEGYRRKYAYLARVNTLRMRRKSVIFIRKLEEIIVLKTNCVNRVKLLIDVTNEKEKSSCMFKKAGAIISFGSSIIGFGAFGLGYTAFALSAYTPAILSGTFAGGIFGGGIQIGSSYLEKKTLHKKFSEIESEIKTDEETTEKLIRTAKEFFEEIEEYQIFICTYIKSGYCPIEMDETGSYMLYLKKCLEYLFGNTRGLDLYEWINCLGQLMNFCRPLLVQAIPTVNNSVNYSRIFQRQVATGVSLADEAASSFTNFGSKILPIIFICGGVISLLSSIKDINDANDQAEKIEQYLSKLKDVTKNIERQLESINSFGEQIHIYKEMIDADPGFNNLDD